MTLIVTGIALGLIVSVPPGPNSALCVNLACGGMRRAVPLITGAALTDAAYSLLAASGILIASRAGGGILVYLTPCFMLATALLAWSPSSLPTKVGIGVAFFNPATAAIWLSLSSVPALRALSLADLLLRPIPVALGTAAWFTLLAAAAAKAGARLPPERTVWMQKLLASLLAIAGLVGLAAALS
jgi:threonine/homoserine/homoserine lactone efflux protein